MLEEINHIRLAAQGDQKSFRFLVEKHKDYVFSILISMLKNRAEAEEAAQDTFIKVYKSISKYESRSKFSSWLYSIAYRTGLDYIRKRKPMDSLDTIGATTVANNLIEGPSTDIEQRELRALLEVEINKLDPSDAAVLRLFYFKEMNIKEIADITSLSESNIKVKLFRSRKLLKVSLDRSQLKDLI